MYKFDNKYKVPPHLFEEQGGDALMLRFANAAGSKQHIIQYWAPSPQGDWVDRSQCNIGSFFMDTGIYRIKLVPKEEYIYS